MTCLHLALLALLLVAALPAHARPDLVVADFEGDDYGGWQVEGAAFGAGPARGTLPGQMPVSGFEGRGLVNSFSGGDGPTGRLTSPPFTIERRYLNFLIGGGCHPGETCLNLLVGGKVVRTATGPNDRPGGTERLDWATWDVGELAGQQAVLEVVDTATGGWGHINVDSITQSDTRKASPPMDLERQITIAKRYLHLPAQLGDPQRLSIIVDGEVAESVDVVLADATPVAWFPLDVSRFRGQTVTLKVGHLPAGSQGLKAIRQGDTPPRQPNLYREALRPQLHFSPARGWTNDPNGLVYYAGEWHLFFQHNPYGVSWSNMHWGHAVSPDLVHWTELPVALAPDRFGPVYSGSAVVDWRNTAGLQQGKEKTLAAFYTGAGDPCVQVLAYSNDRGRTWAKDEGNPVIPHIIGGNRDPKVVWDDERRQWVLALYLDGNDFALFTSPNLRAWQRIDTVTVPDSSECPDFFPITIEGTAERRWVFTAANGHYLVGSFDGARFTPEQPARPADWGANYYAVQTYSDAPDGRRVQIAWMAGGSYPGMPFNQQMSFPCELTLRRTADGLRLDRYPVPEIKGLWAKERRWQNQVLPAGPLAGVAGELFDLEGEFDLTGLDRLAIEANGHPLTYTVATQTISCLGKEASLPLADGRLRLRVLVDRTSIEVFANGGEVSMTSCCLPTGRQGLSLATPATVVDLKVRELKPIWGH